MQINSQTWNSFTLWYYYTVTEENTFKYWNIYIEKDLDTSCPVKMRQDAVIKNYEFFDSPCRYLVFRKCQDMKLCRDIKTRRQAVMISTMTFRKCVHEYMNFIARCPKAKAALCSFLHRLATVNILAFNGRLFETFYILWCVIVKIKIDPIKSKDITSDIWCIQSFSHSVI